MTIAEGLCSRDRAGDVGATAKPRSRSLSNRKSASTESGQSECFVAKAAACPDSNGVAYSAASTDVEGVGVTLVVDGVIAYCRTILLLC